jgi:putative oxidoreductase
VSLKGFRGGRARAESGSFSQGLSLQRLFSTFPCGLPGAGLALLRAAAAIPLVYAGLLTVASSSPVLMESPVLLKVITAGAAFLLLIGLWTPVAGALIAVVELGLAVSHPAERWMYVHFAVMGAALAMLGPGGCSVDARLFGRKHIQIPGR